MNKIVLIQPYFGKLPQYFNLWLKSAEKNSDIDFLLYCDFDIESFASFPPNVKLIKMTFDELKNHIQSFFDFEITLSKPYKLCDYRPAFGMIFQQDIKNYQFWGHFDLDVILGDISKFLPKEDFDKIYHHGHLTIYKNTPENNKRFMLDGGLNYKNVFTTDYNCIFDETRGIQKKFEILNIPVYKEYFFADVARRRKNFTLNTEIGRENYKYQIFYYDNGRILRDYFDGGKMNTDEFNYIHFSHRSLEDKTDGSNSFYITRFGCIKKDGETTLDIIKKYNAPTPVQNIFCAINTQIIRRIKRYFKLMYYKISKG